MDNKKLKEMDKLRADTDIINPCGSDKEGTPNPIIPQKGTCETKAEPLDPKAAPKAQGGLDEEERESFSDKANKAGAVISNKAGDVGNVISEKAASGKDFLVEKYESATAGVEEREHQDSYVFADSVIEKIAGIAAREIKGILALKGNLFQNVAGSLSNDDSFDPKRGVNVEIGENSVVVDLKMILEYGAPAPDIFKRLRQHIGQQLNIMTGLELVELNVEVVDVMTKEEYREAAQSRWSSYTPEPYNAQYANPYQDSYQQRQPQQQPTGYQGQNQRGSGFRGNF